MDNGKTHSLEFWVDRLHVAIWQAIIDGGTPKVQSVLFDHLAAFAKDRFEAGKKSLFTEQEIDDMLKALVLYEEGGHYLSDMHNKLGPIRDKLRALRIKKD